MSMPSLSDDEDWADTDCMEDDPWSRMFCPDLFSDQILPSALACLTHMQKHHGFDLKDFIRRTQASSMTAIQLINYIRGEKPTPKDLNALVETRPWRSDHYLKKRLAAALRATEDSCQDLTRDMERMKVVAQALVGSDSGQDLPPTTLEPSSDQDSIYAGSYSHFGIHHEMLSDRVRTEGYRDAIYKNGKSNIQDREVLDLGCGTGILSLFCAKAGARRVTGVDMSDIIHNAMDIVLENGMDSCITLIKGKLETCDLKTDQFDVIVSEWMGYFLLFEGMLDSVILARNKYLKKGGKVLPNRCTMHLVGVSDPNRYAQTVDYWRDVYGFQMSCMKQPVLVEASIEVVPTECVASPPILIHELDLATCEVADTEFECKFNMTILKDCELTCIAGYFDSFFDLDTEQTMFTTGPHGQPTHWKQTLFYLKEKISVKQDQIVDGHIRVTRPSNEVRSLIVQITLDGQEQVFRVE
eukprot:maker-scaffold804_size94796-snap-gene-0.21 protein:Tk06342 transcript:maker-scaffold804_size94796-snap-gene-0.21-mRNA-1 annotation:"protein arginine n-methyltransferase 3"